jgi:hypothetical protein
MPPVVPVAILPQSLSVIELCLFTDRRIVLYIEEVNEVALAAHLNVLQDVLVCDPQELKQVLQRVFLTL